MDVPGHPFHHGDKDTSNDFTLSVLPAVEASSAYSSPSPNHLRTEPGTLAEEKATAYMHYMAKHNIPLDTKIPSSVLKF